MVDKTIVLYYHKYSSQEKNNINKKKLKVTIWYSNIFEEEKKKKKRLQISKFWIIGINMLILSRWPTHQYDKPTPLDATKNHTNEVFKTLFEDFKKLRY